ncbi:hypothetical protein D3C84_595030 [compost metagenome]
MGTAPLGDVLMVDCRVGDSTGVSAGLMNGGEAIAGKAGLCLEVGIESEVRAVNGKLYAGSA